PRVIAVNKVDLPAAAGEHFPNHVSVGRGGSAPTTVAISVKTGEGIERLIDAVAAALSTGESFRDQPQVTNVRHIVLLEHARESLSRAASALASKVSEEFPLLDLQEASASLQEITGQRTSDDLLRHIFERFCIGK